MSNRERLLEAIQTAVDQGQITAVNELALQLSSTFPQSGMTIEQICVAIEAAQTIGRERTAEK